MGTPAYLLYKQFSVVKWIDLKWTSFLKIFGILCACLDITLSHYIIWICSHKISLQVKAENWKSIWKIMPLKNSVKQQIKPKHLWNFISGLSLLCLIFMVRIQLVWGATLGQQLSLNIKFWSYFRGLKDNDVIWPPKTQRPQKCLKFRGGNQNSISQLTKISHSFISLWEALVCF